MIIIAWTTTEMVPDGRPSARDLGCMPGMRETTVAHAAMWLRKGTDADAGKAAAFVLADYPDTGRVFRFSKEKDPLGRARREMLAAVGK